jgi:hypothetical protein
MAEKPPTESSGKQEVKKAPKLVVLESLNWLIHLYYVKKEFKQCKDLIKIQLMNTNGLCEYALYVQGNFKAKIRPRNTGLIYFYLLRIDLETRRPHTRVTGFISNLRFAQPHKCTKYETNSAFTVGLIKYRLRHLRRLKSFALRFLIGRHKAAIDVYTETLKQIPDDWVSLQSAC